jgi:hypothetical protein
VITFALTSQGPHMLVVTSAKGDKQALIAKSPVTLPVASAPFHLLAYP